MIATTSLGTSCRSFPVVSVWVLLSTRLGLGHSFVEDEAAGADAAVDVAAVAAAAEVVAKCPKNVFCIASLKRPTGRYQWPLLPIYHLEVDVVASWTNVATSLVHAPNLSCAAAEHGIHLLKTVDPEKSWKVRATHNSGSEVAQVFATLRVFQANGYCGLLIQSLRTIAHTATVFCMR